MKGTVLKNRYELTDLVDKGGMGLIYRGKDTKTGRNVAIKILKPEHSDNKKFVQRFIKEANATASLKHKNIVRVLDCGSEGGVYFIVQEFIDGMTLKNLILEKGAMNFEEAIELMTEICSAMQYAHEKGLIHRDIKPQNILVDKKGNVKITDFGIAKDVTSSTLTGFDTEIMGSVHYFSPEQAKGDTVDLRSDIYSLGIVFYEMVTGLLPFDGDTSIAVAIKHINETVRPPKEINAAIPKSVNDIILKATRKDREFRYKTAREFETDLQKALVMPKGRFVKLKHDQESRKAKKDKYRPRRNIIFLSVMTFLILAIMGTIILMASSMFHESKQDVINVPKLVGMTEVDALSEGAKIGLKIDKQYEYSGKVKETFVISQNPKPGKEVSKDTVIIIVISQGEKPFEAPNIIDETVDTAAEELKNFGLALGNIAYEESDKPEGYIVSQTPEPGEMIAEGEAIDVIVSGKDMNISIVPPVTGKKLEDAASDLSKAGFVKFLIYEDENNKPEGTVINQSPPEGLEHDREDWVTVWISGYKSKSYSAVYAKSLTIEEPNTVVRVLLEEDLNGILAHFVADERTFDAGQKTVSQRIYSGKKGSFNVLIYEGKNLADKVQLNFD